MATEAGEPIGGHHAPFLIRPVLGLLTAALVFATAAFSYPAAAQNHCIERAKALSHLSQKYGESVVGMGLTGSGEIMEVLTSPTGTWSVIVTRPDGSTCLVIAGKDWLTLPPVEKIGHPI